MKRTQLYLNDETHSILNALSKQTKKTVSLLVREAVADKYGKKESVDKLTLCKQISGIWKDRKDVVNVEKCMRKGEEEVISNLFLILDSLFINEGIGKKAGEYLSRYSKSHSLEIADALTAATAFHFRLPLWTLNSKHFPMKDINLLKI